VPNYKRWFVEAGFEDVVEVNYRWPSNHGVRIGGRGCWVLVGAPHLCYLSTLAFILEE
jgi:hypothetical protein